MVEMGAGRLNPRKNKKLILQWGSLCTTRVKCMLMSKVPVKETFAYLTPGSLGSRHSIPLPHTPGCGWSLSILMDNIELLALHCINDVQSVTTVVP